MRRMTVAAATLLAVGLLGCGGGSHPTSSSSGQSESAERMAKAEFIEAADAMCKKDEEEGNLEQRKSELEALSEEELESHAGEVALGELLHAQADEADAALRGIAELNPPPGERELISKIVERGEAANDRADEAATAIEEGRVAEAETLVSEGQMEGDKVEEAMKRYGFKVCSQVREE